VVDSDEPFVEESWIGQTITVGRASLRVATRIDRCRMINIAQDGVTPERRWLTALAAQRGMNVAVYADVAVPGPVHIGDPLSGTTYRTDEARQVGQAWAGSTGRGQTG
jgi:uncharacterized protein YcbX